MNSHVPYQPLPISDARCADLTTMAERELSAFFNAVSELFGAEQAELSAKDWLQEVEFAGLPTSMRGWRSITAKASTRLASRLNLQPLSTESQIA